MSLRGKVGTSGSISVTEEDSPGSLTKTTGQTGDKGVTRERGGSSPYRVTVTNPYLEDVDRYSINYRVN